MNQLPDMNICNVARSPIDAQPSFARTIRVLAVLAILLLACSVRADVWRLVEEHWFVLEVDGQPAGRMGSFLHEKEDQLRSTADMVIAIDRATVGTNIEIRTEFIEGRDGRAVSMGVRQVMSQQPMETWWKFEDERVIEVTRLGEREMKREHPRPKGTWLTPRAVQRFMVERARAGAMEVTYRALDPTRGVNPLRVTRRRDGEAMFSHEGREIPVTIWRTVSEDSAPLEAIEHITSDGHLVYQKFTMGLGEMVMRWTSKEEAFATDDAPGPELFIRTVVQPDKPIRNVMDARTLRLRLRAKAGELPDLPSAGSQRVAMADDRMSAILMIDVNDPLKASDEELTNEEYVTASPLIDSDDELVRALTRRAVRSLEESNREDKSKRAEAMRAFVFEYISDKGLDTAFASASETARTRTGDCTEHAVLLAAMLRADGIPARTASGLVYIDEFLGQRGVFGWHMWTQALLDGKWIDLDSTLPVPYHAGHITTTVSSLAVGGSTDTAMMLLMGNLEIEVLKDE